VVWEIAERDRQWAAEREADAQSREAARVAQAANLVRSREVLEALNVGDAPRETIVEIIAAEYPLPWKWAVDDYGATGVQDAQGDWVTFDNSDSAAAMVVMALVNAAAGHVSEVAERPPEDPEDEGEDEAEQDAADPPIQAADSEDPDAEIPGFLRRLAGGAAETPAEAL
jgi:hypothetical protein